MHTFLAEDRIHYTAWIYDVDPELDVLYVDGRGEVVFSRPDDEWRLKRGGALALPAVPYVGLREVAAAVERLFARAAMMASPVPWHDLDAHFARLGLGRCVYRFCLAGEQVALPASEEVGLVARCSGYYGMFLYPRAVVRVAR